MRKVLTHDLREIFRRCKHRFDLQQRGVKGVIDEKTAYFRRLGKIGELATDCRTKEEQRALVLHEIKQLPVAQQQTALVEVDQMVTRAHAMTSKTAKIKRQHQFSWVDDQPWTPDAKNPYWKPKFPEPTFFSFYAKPDHTEDDVDEHGARIFRIVDGKGAESVRTKDKRQLFFFGFVASKHFAREEAQALARGESYEMPSIQLVVGALRSPAILVDQDLEQQRKLGRNIAVASGVVDVKEVFWYKRAREAGSLDEYRGIIADMLEAERLGLFPASLDWDCSRCPFGKMVNGDPTTLVCDTYRNKVLQQQQGENADIVA